MELKRLLDRANVLLLQGAYQGAESFIEQAMAEADKLKSELAEIDTLRTRVTEMAAEVDRLQSVIDEANAQAPVGYTGSGSIDAVKVGVEGHLFGSSAPSHPIALYAHPIPAQQSPAVAAPEFNGWYCAQCQCGVDPSEVTFHETHTVCGRRITDDLPPTSPRITEQDAREIIESYFRFNEDREYTDTGIDSFFKLIGRTLLNKLNGVES